MGVGQTHLSLFGEVRSLYYNSKKMTNKKQKIIIYIDGFNLYYGVRSLGQFYKWLDIQALAESFTKSDNSIILVKYFTAKLNGNNENTHRQAIYLDAISRHCTKVKIIKGYFTKARKCKHCDVKNNEEKQTDVNIASEMMHDLCENNFDIAYLVSGDSDLVTPVKKISTMNKIVLIAFPPNRKSKELINVATNYFDIKESRLKKCQLPNAIPTKRSFLKRPEKWTKIKTDSKG
jgi:uncharacterized LabA/DUF88 family protein